MADRIQLTNDQNTSAQILMKLDTQGSELEILEGASNLLPLLLAERQRVHQVRVYMLR